MPGRKLIFPALLGWFRCRKQDMTDERYVRIACGLCYKVYAAPVSGKRIGQKGENLKVTVRRSRAGTEPVAKPDRGRASFSHNRNDECTQWLVSMNSR